MTQAVSAYGTLLKIGDGGGSEVFTTIAEVTNITGPGSELETIDVTSHDSTGAKREFIAGLIDMGEITLSLNFNALTTQGFAGGLYNDHMSRTKRNFQLVLPTTSNKTGSFAAYVTNFEPDAPVDGALTADVTLKVTGAVTWA